MYSVEEAFLAILTGIRPLGTQRVPLRECAGCVLAEDVHAPEAVPPFDNSAMDGYAVRREDCLGASAESPVTLRVIADIPAGMSPGVTVQPGTAARIMTGAPMPAGADAVVMREDTRESASEVAILLAPDPAENVRRVGDDVSRGSRVFASGDVLTPAALGVLASIGVAEVSVVRRARVAILATGDELVEVTEALAPGQIRNSTAYALEALVAALGAVPVRLGIARDNADELRARLREGAGHDLLLTTGGVSVGDHDLVKQVLGELGQVGFWRVNMQPGKPLAYGHVDGTPVIGLPGNPVSSLVAFELFVRPAIRRLQGHGRLQRPRVAVTLMADYEKRGDRRLFLRAHVTVDGGRFVAALTGPQGSHVLTSMARGNALLDLPVGPRRYAAGDLVDAILLEEGESYAGRNPDGE